MKNFKKIYSIKKHHLSKEDQTEHEMSKWKRYKQKQKKSSHS